MSGVSGTYILQGAFRFVPERAEYIGVVSKLEGKDLTVLTIGAEQSEWDILDWIKNTIDLMRAEGKLDVQAPDMYDRARVAAEVSGAH
jgi:hypothetical protein